MPADRRPNGHGPRGLASSRSARRGRGGPRRYCRSGDREQLQGNGEALIEPSTPARPSQLAQTALPQCPCPNGWVPFTRVHLGQRVGRPAQGRSQNTQHQTRQKRRTTDAGPRTTAPRKTSIPTTTEQSPATRQAPAWAPFTFQGLSSRAKARGSWPFREGPTSSTHLDPSPLAPCSLIAIRRFNRRADEKGHGAVRCASRGAAREDWRNHGTHSRMRRARGQAKTATNG